MARTSALEVAPPVKLGTYETRRLRLPLAGPTGGSGVTAVDILVVSLTDADGCTGLGFTYTLGPVGARAIAEAAEELLEVVAETIEFDTPVAAFKGMTGLLNRVGRGAHYLAIAAIDMALWDIHAKRAGCSLGVAMGGCSRPVPVYGSGGFRPGMDPGEAVEQAHRYVEEGCRAVKLRLTGERSDGEFLEAVRARLTDDIGIMVDINEKGSLEKALWLADVCRANGVLWLEEPLSAHDYEGYRQLASRTSVAIAAGEHLQGQAELYPFVSSRTLAVVQPDHAMMGGLSGTLRVTHLCEAFGLAVAPHFLPSLFVHLASVSDNVTWLEDFPLLEPLFVEPPRHDANGFMTLPAVEGHGLSLDPNAFQRYAV